MARNLQADNEAQDSVSSLFSNSPDESGNPAGAPPVPAVSFSAALLRPDDLLNLKIEGVNLQLDAQDPSSPFLAPIDAAQPSLLIVHFPPQTAAEEAFFEQSGYPPKGVESPDSKRVDDPTLPSMTVEPAGAKIANRIGGPSRLVFRVPAGARLLFSIEGLLDWSQLELQVPPAADVEPGAEPPDAALTLREPYLTETALELPYRLLLSPTHAVAWVHAFQSVTYKGRTELWHTRLALRKPDGGIQRTDNDHTLPLRAVWSPDYNPAKMPSPGDFGPLGALGAMSPYDRHQIVVLTSAYRGYAANASKVYTPLPVQASLLMLSPLGGWLRSFGMWEPPYKIKPWFDLEPLRWREIFQVQRLQPDAGPDNAPAGMDEAPSDPGGAPAGPAGVPPFEDLAEGPLNDLLSIQLERERLFDFVLPIYNLGQQLDLSQWAHIAAQGRDHYVRIVYEGKLKCLGNRAALIKVTERRFEPDPQTGSPVAYLRQYMYIVVREPEKDYTKEGLKNVGRGMLLKKVRLTTLVTPKIDYPYAGLPRITDRSFWVMVGGKDFIFHGIGEDAGGNKVDLDLPLIFVPNSEQDFLTIHKEFTKKESIKRRAAAVPGQKVVFAGDGSDGNENTRLTTQSLNFENESADPDGFFKPRLFKAEIRLPAVEQLVGANTPVTISYNKDYLEKGFEDAGNATGLFAEIVKENDLGVLEPASLGVAFSANQAGGFATPSLDVTSLTRSLGPLGGKVDQAYKDEFDPNQVFKKGLATLFGSFDLAQLILPGGTAGRDAPKMQVHRQNGTIIAELDWKPGVRNVDLTVIKFQKHDDTQLAVHGEFKKTLGAPADDQFTLKGDLNHFNILLFKVMQINFDLFSFTAQSGKKTDVDVKLDDNKPVEFMGDLAFVEGLRKLIPPGVFGDGVSIDLIQNPLGVKAGLAITLPPASVGVFALQNISFSAGLTIPFMDGKPSVDFGFASRENMFMLTVAFLGGGGFFHIELDPAGIRMLEAAFEFGAAASIDIGVASGEVHIMAGIYFKMEKKVVAELGNKEVMVSLLSGYLRMGGKLSVLGLISISVEFMLSFTYNSDTDKATGRATLTVTIEIAFFSTSVELTVERSFGGKGGDPTFAQLVDSPEVWAEYAGAFA